MVTSTWASLECPSPSPLLLTYICLVNIVSKKEHRHGNPPHEHTTTPIGEEGKEVKSRFLTYVRVCVHACVCVLACACLGHVPPWFNAFFFLALPPLSASHGLTFSLPVNFPSCDCDQRSHVAIKAFWGKHENVTVSHTANHDARSWNSNTIVFMTYIFIHLI